MNSLGIWITLTMIKTRVIRKTRNIDKMIEKIKALKAASVQSGYFIEQGIHSTIGIPYTTLMQNHEFGFGVPQRHLRQSAFDVVSNSKINRKEIKNFLFTGENLDTYLNKSGARIANTAKSLFGVVSPQVPSNAPMTIALKGGNDTPLVDTGELRDAWSFRTSSNLSIRGF